MESKHDADAPLAGLRVMVADDEFLIASDLEEMFLEAGADVVGPYMTHAAALEGAQQEAISVAVLDIRLGFETTGDVAAVLDSRGIPFLFFSGQFLPDDISARLPHATTLIKPVRHQVLVDAVSLLVGR